MPNPDHDLDDVLTRLAAGERGAADELLPLVYEELRDLATRQLRQERAGHTLQPTALVHEVYLRLAKPAGADWKGRGQFLAVAAQAMRRILINHARDRARLKRGGDASRITLDRILDVLEGDAVDIVALDDALTRLAELSERQARVVELRVFGGLTIDETARVLGIGMTTAKKEWQFAKAWLKREFLGAG